MADAPAAPSWAEWRQLEAQLAAEQSAIAGNGWATIHGGLESLQEPDGGLRGYPVPPETRQRWRAMRERMTVIWSAMDAQRTGRAPIVCTPL